MYPGWLDLPESGGSRLHLTLTRKETLVLSLQPAMVVDFIIDLASPSPSLPMFVV